MNTDLKPKYSLLDYIKASKKLGSSAADLKIAVLRSFTCEILENILPVELHSVGIGSKLFFGGYNSFFQDTFNETGELYNFKPDVLIYAIRIEDIAHEGLRACLTNGAASTGSVTELTDSLDKMLSFAKEELCSRVIIHNFTKPSDSAYGIHQQTENGINNAIRKLNIRLSEICASKGVYIADVDDIISEIGRNEAFDPRMWEIAKNPYSFTFYVRLALLYSKYIYAFFFPRKKCVILDLDNTLWNGVIGESGDCRPYISFQNELKRLSKTGIILAIASKNNFSDVLEFFDKHDMPLKINDFSALKINWEDKPGNILKITEELNILPDSLVYFDDNPAERELVRKTLGEVYVVDFPDGSQPSEQDFLSALRVVYGLDYLELTPEDKSRTEMYRAARERKEYEHTAQDLESFLRGLEMKARIFLITGDNIERAAQLTQKTNQFNLTTKRYSEADLRNRLQRGFFMYGLKLSDKFGDYGMTGLMIIQPEADSWIIDSFLLSCRVMSRGVEYLFMAEIIRIAKESSVNRLIASYIPTGKNKPVEKLYEDMGFINKVVFWEWNFSAEFKAPDYIALIRG